MAVTLPPVVPLLALRIRAPPGQVAGTLTATAAGAPSPAAVAVKVPATRPGGARIRSASSGVTGGKVTAIARWAAPRSDGGAKVNGYQVYGYRLNDRGAVVQTVTSSVRTPSTRSWQPTLHGGRWQFAVRARNSVGWGKLSARSSTVTAR